ncbi:hypothetical protein J421_4706 (plasmid) [Gemmatirosa kalamazoonensis]|uniref:Uncharacterized protein n=1 Tax=Gemmatirosa kalamazoonensis TaxID=861299 RepID=W0RNC6_9BACT|nr:hypothetical protein [Gemmatirosa kalamazoonensis]AHG92241.1 hypothetical protein J421_4706 [Gemmatirosa kalamazoonensis]
MSTDPRASRFTSTSDLTVGVGRDGPARLVAELWRRLPPGADTLSDSGGGGSEQCVAELRRSLAAAATEAKRMTLDGPPLERSAARLLAETAQAVHDALGASHADGVTPWMDRLRFARMERWLAARADDDVDAEPAASLCLWVIEHLEMAVPLPRRIVPP